MPCERSRNGADAQRPRRTTAATARTADIDGLHRNRDAEAFGEIAAELLVPRRRAAKTMVQVSEGNDAEALLLREFLQ